MSFSILIDKDFIHLVAEAKNLGAILDSSLLLICHIFPLDSFKMYPESDHFSSPSLPSALSETL